MEKYDDLVELLDMKIYSEDVLKESLEKSGFKDFKAYIDDENDWICFRERRGALTSKWTYRTKWKRL